MVWEKVYDSDNLQFAYRPTVTPVDVLMQGYIQALTLVPLAKAMAISAAAKYSLTISEVD